MNRLRQGLLIGLTAVLALGLLATVSGRGVQARLRDALYDLGWSTVDGGGARLTGDSYVLVSTAGQPEAAPAVSGGDRYTLQSGFWPSGAAPEPGGYRVYLPMVTRQ